MIELIDKLALLSFEDNQVIKMEMTSDQLRIHVDGAQLPGQPTLALGHGSLVFDQVSKVTATVYGKNTKKVASDPMTEPLATISECCFYDFVSRLTGFSKTSDAWVEWIFLGKPTSAKFEHSLRPAPNADDLIHKFKNTINENYPESRCILDKIRSDSLYECAELFCATFFEYENYVFIKETFSKNRLKEIQYSTDSYVESWMNQFMLDDLFETSKDAIAFIDLLVTVWDEKLKKQFPERHFQVEKIESEEDENYITFYQKV